MKLTGGFDIYLEVAQYYKEYIEAGILKDGDKLPSVRNAAEEFGINPNTVAKAYAKLEEDGFIYSIPKKGAYVKSSIKDDKQNNLLIKRKIEEIKSGGVSKHTLINIIDEIYGGEND